ncbi:MAG: FAD-dependent oxidoreductase [Methylobacter sp.]
MPLIPFLPACRLDKMAMSDVENEFLSRAGPINHTLTDQAPLTFTGDDFVRPHQILWNKPAFIEAIGERPKPKRKEELVIIGGGMSGLMSAYLLRKKKPMILEQAGRFGGNAKGESWNGLHYSIGAAYLIKPGEDSGLFKLFKDLGIVNDWSIKSGDGGHFVLNGQLVENFWNGASEPAHKAKYKRLYDYFMSYLKEGGNLFPDYPTDDIKLREYINKLDQEDFKSHLEKNIGSDLPDHAATLLEHYCFSSLGGSLTEISAAAGINFFAAEFDDVAVFPGGNSYIAEALLKHLYMQLPANNLLAGHLVFDVQAQQEGVLISYLDPNNEAHSILAEKVIMSCPKFVAAKLIDRLSSKKAAAISELEYRAYVVANLLINHPITETDYDIYWLGQGKADFKNVAAYARGRGITDVINANFSSPDLQKTVLSFYQALPYQGGRAELYAGDSYASMKARISAQLKKEVYPFYDLKEQDIVDLRLTRWGHPLPLASVGLLQRGIVDTLREPIDNRIFFVEQDNWALPAIETVAAEAIHWSSMIR